jgi:hypothetical protein
MTEYKAGIGFLSEDSYIIVKGSERMDFSNCFFASKYGYFGNVKEGYLVLPGDDVVVLAGSQETADRILKEILEKQNNA